MANEILKIVPYCLQLMCVYTMRIYYTSRASLIFQITCDIKQILREIFSLLISIVLIYEWFKNETRQYQMVLLYINGWSSCLKTAVFSFWHILASTLVKVGLIVFSAVSMGNIETVKGQKWSFVACPEHDLRDVHIIPTLHVWCLVVNLRQASSYCTAHNTLLCWMAEY